MTPGRYIQECRRAAKKSRCQVAVEARLHIELLNAYEADRLDVPPEWRLTICAAVGGVPAVLIALCAGRASSHR